jgi:hypothetical protein
MATVEELEKRVAELEREVEGLKRRNPAGGETNGTIDATEVQGGTWVDQIAGGMKNNPAAQEIARLGREWRESVRDSGNDE